MHPQMLKQPLQRVRQKADVHFMVDARARCDIYSSRLCT